MENWYLEPVYSIRLPATTYTQSDAQTRLPKLTEGYFKLVSQGLGRLLAARLLLRALFSFEWGDVKNTSPLPLHVAVECGRLIRIHGQYGSAPGRLPVTVSDALVFDKTISLRNCGVA